MQVASTNRNGNPGIVPPWLQHPDRNPGIVPPWLQGRPVQPSTPVDDDTPRILRETRTVYEPTPITPDPEVPRIWGA